MESGWRAFGHERAKQILSKQLSEEVLPHAYLFLGPAGTGKKALALEFAGKILQTEKLSSHPDFSIIDTGPESSVAGIREFIANLGFKPFVAKKKIAIINNAHNLNVQSSNALLKTLEEPSPSTIIILIAASKPLQTIFSRCVTVNFNALTQNQLKEYAKLSNLKISDKILNLSFGSIERMEKLAGDKEFFRQQEQIIEKLEEIKRGKLLDRILAISDFADAENEGLENTFLVWYRYQAQKLRENPDEFSSLTALSNSINDLKINKNKKMVLQGLFLKI